MPALRDRQAARERMQQVFGRLLDRYIPADQTRPVRGQTFLEWEDQADEFDQELLSVFLEELAGLHEGARAQEAGPCPHCGQTRTYLVKGSGRQTEMRSKHGVVVLTQQQCRCRACDRTFSPSGPGVGSGGAGADVHAQGGPAGGDRSGDGIV